MRRVRTWQLFAICIVVWGTTWHAITYQLSDLGPEVGVAVRLILGGVLGIVGVGLVVWPQIAGPAGGRGALGAAFTVAAVLLSAVGSLIASRNRSRGAALLPAMGFGMPYGALAAAIVAAVIGGRVGWPASWQTWVALGWLSLGGSIIAFACFLTLQDRLGPGPAGTVGVMVPLLALVVSVAFEGLRPDLLTALGAAVAVLGNGLMLWPARGQATAAQSPLTGAAAAAE